MAESLGLELLGRERGDVYLAGGGAERCRLAARAVPTPELVRVVAPPSDAVAEDGLIRTAMVGCAAVVNGYEATDAELRVASALAVPVCEGDDLVWDCIVPAFAFVVCRLERDFAHAREAIRTAVESARRGSRASGRTTAGTAPQSRALSTGPGCSSATRPS